MTTTRKTLEYLHEILLDLPPQSDTRPTTEEGWKLVRAHRGLNRAIEIVARHLESERKRTAPKKPFGKAPMGAGVGR